MERETDWILKGSKKTSKKRKAESSPGNTVDSHPENNRKQSNGRKSGALMPQSMSQQTEWSQTINYNKKRNLLPPPINILGLTDHSQVKALMSTVTNKDYKLTALNNNVWKICTADAESYRHLANKLNTDKIQWYTYENKSCRSIRVMARGLHPTCDRQDILEDLQQRGIKPIDAVNIIKREKDVDNKGNNVVRKIGLPLFMITFDQEEISENFFGLKSILNMKVKIEPD